MSEVVSGEILYNADEGLEVVRFFRKIKPEHVEAGHFRAGEDVEHIIPHTKLAAIIAQTMTEYTDCLKAFERAVAGKGYKTFYAEYRVHPDDAERAARNTAGTLAEWERLCEAARSLQVPESDIKKAQVHSNETPCWKTVAKSIWKLKNVIPAQAAA